MKKLVVYLLVLVFSTQGLAATSFFEKFQAAEEAFIDGYRDEAYREFEEFVNQFSEYARTPEQKRSVFYSYMRLAQLEVSEKKRKEFIGRAIQVSQSEKPDPELFPPPVVSEFKEAKKAIEPPDVSVENLKITRPMPNYQEPHIASLSQPAPVKKWYKNKWLWIGLAVVTTGVVIANSKSDPDEKEPKRTTRRGF